MAYTIGDEAWEYIDLLNECIKIILTVGLGITMGYFKIFDAETFVKQAVKFVFHVALPLHILRGIGVIVDFYDGTFQWEYIEAFLVLRVFGLVLCVGWVLAASIRGGRQEGIGQVAVLWLALTWVSTVILGVPISKAVFGTEAQGMKYGLVSSLNLCVGYTIAHLMSHTHTYHLTCHSVGRNLFFHFPAASSTPFPRVSCLGARVSRSKKAPGTQQPRRRSPCGRRGSLGRGSWYWLTRRDRSGQRSVFR
jgi:hypothetical protein